MSIEALIAELRRRAEDELKEVDPPRPALAPATPQQIADAERQLGTQLPEVLRRLYLEVSNGGFGPGYLLMGVDGGFRDDQGCTSLDLYASFRERDPEDPSWAWPEKLIPFCHWGCAIYSCIDLASEDADIVIWDPNVLDSSMGTSSGLRPHGRGLPSWLEAWLKGSDLWEEMFPGASDWAQTDQRDST